jgi:hypothetical protein
LIFDFLGPVPWGLAVLSTVHLARLPSKNVRFVEPKDRSELTFFCFPVLAATTVSVALFHARDFYGFDYNAIPYKYVVLWSCLGATLLSVCFEIGVKSWKNIRSSKEYIKPLDGTGVDFTKRIFGILMLMSMLIGFSALWYQYDGPLPIPEQISLRAKIMRGFGATNQIFGTTWMFNLAFASLSQICVASTRRLWTSWNESWAVR